MAPKFREAQEQVIEGYQGGLMGISAVPGSGKTFTLSHLAARLVEKLISEYGTGGQEVLIVTFSNSAVNGFKKRIADILQYERRLLPSVGYRVRTLHGLAHDIVRERPALLGLPDDFQIVDERTASAIREDIVRSLLPNHQRLLEAYIDPMLEEKRRPFIMNTRFPELLVNVVEQFINHAKDNQLSPEMLQTELDASTYNFDLAQFCTAVYADYQRSLAFRGAVDFSDLVHLALLALRLDPQFLQRLQERWVYILEDEAQDSSALQEQMLRLLSAGRNWVRVGDPNQAINTTFTTANPAFLSHFLAEEKVSSRALPVSGRSSRRIISLANELVRWATEQHPVEELRGAFFPQDILPTDADDPQQNPANEASNIHIHFDPDQKLNADDELLIVTRSLEKYVSANPHKTVAVLVPENSRGFKLTEMLRKADVPYEELLRSSTSTRVVAAYLRTILSYLSTPYQSDALARLYRDVWWKISLGRVEEELSPDALYQHLRKFRHVEELLYPLEARSVAAILGLEGAEEAIIQDAEKFRFYVQRWLAALSLPIDQLILTITQDIFSEVTDIALAYRLAALMRGYAEEHPDWEMPQYIEELRVIMDNQRRFIGFEDATTGFEPSPGVVTVATMHAAKGLEWDRVYLMAVNNYSFPSLVMSDRYAGQKWFVRDQLNLEMVALAQLYAIKQGRPGSFSEGEASYQAFFENAAERLRLLYVGITRAREDLIMTWNTGREGGPGATNTLSLPAVHLQQWLNGRR